jgi:hypothetical protein
LTSHLNFAIMLHGSRGQCFLPKRQKNRNPEA